MTELKAREVLKDVSPVWEKFLRFKKKELKRMCQEVRETIKRNDCAVIIKKYYVSENVIYELIHRVQYKWYIRVYAPTIAEAKELFINKAYNAIE